MSNETANKAKLFAKVAKVMTAVRTLPKDGTNTFDRYNYITGDAVFERIGQAMASVNLAAIPSVVELTTEAGKSSNDKPMLRTVIHGQITLADGDTGETWTSDWYGEGADRGDKSINKAMTAMMKYYLLRLFMVGSGEDADEESPEVKPQAKQQPQAQTQRPNASPTPSHRQPEATPTPASNGNDNGKSKAFKAFQAEGANLFNGSWNDARHWLIERYTKKMTPDHVRTSANELTDAELVELTSSIKSYGPTLKSDFSKQPAKETA